MGYQDSDILLYFIVIGVIIAVYVFKNKQTPKPPSKDQILKREMPENTLLNQPLAQRVFPGDIKGVFVFVTAPDPQVHMMAMSLAMQVKTKGKSVRILLCGPGGDLGLKNGNEIIFKPLDKSPQMILKNMIQSGIKVEICPFYIANSEKTLADIFDGITMAKPEDVADGLLENGVKLFTF